MASYLLIRHKVRDYAAWKPGYEAHVGARNQAGLTEKYLLRGTQDPNDVTMLFEARDLGTAKAFVESAELKDKMQELGVQGAPDIHFLSS